MTAMTKNDSMPQPARRPTIAAHTRFLIPTAGLALIVASVASAQGVIEPKPRDTAPRSTAPSSGSFGNQATPSRPSAEPDRRGATPRNRPGLGGGTALDGNLQRGSGGINQRSNQPDFSARNFVVTDSVAGGRGFRGSVGYTAAEDFRGATAGDSSYSFRADSALSAAYFLPITTSERYGLAQDMGMFEFRRDATPVSMTSRSATNARLRLDRSAAAISSGRSFEIGTEPTLFASGTSLESGMAVDYLASPIQGLRERRTDNALEMSGLSTYERARLRREAADGRVDASRPISPFISPLIDTNRNEESRFNTRIEPTIPGVRPNPAESGAARGPAGSSSSYDRIVQRIVERYGDDPSVRIDANPNAIERARNELTRLREAMSGRTTRDARRIVDDPLIDPTTGLPKRPTDAPSPNDPSVTPAETEEERAAREAAELRKTVSDAGKVLKHGETITDLSPGDRARVDELVRTGQQQLAAGDYFRAERCFDQALELHPDNPLLFAGLAHSQIGAGLHLSAALTLRTLFAGHPEMIDARYERSLMPNETRLRLGIESLRKRIAQGQDADGFGLTLAYIGHQMGDADLVREGLGHLRGTIENDLLNQLLKQIWLGEETPIEGSAPAPAATPPSGATNEKPVPPAENK
jgi:hypothetical protein